MMKPTTPKTTETTGELIQLGTRVLDFKAALARGIDGIQTAAAIYVKTVDESRSLGDEFRTAAGDFPSTTWRMFERIGRKQIHPMLVFGDSVDSGKARMLRRMPFSSQAQVFAGERFPLTLPSGDILHVSPLDTTPEQTEQLISDAGTIRTPAEQKAWTTSKATIASRTKTPPLPKKPYRITNGHVTFTARTVMTRADIKELLSEM